MKEEGWEKEKLGVTTLMYEMTLALRDIKRVMCTKHMQTWPKATPHNQTIDKALTWQLGLRENSTVDPPNAQAYNNT